MADLKDIIDKPIEEMSTEELEHKLNEVRRLQFRKKAPVTKKKSSTVTLKSNKEKRILDFLSKLDDKKLEELRGKIL